MTEKRGEREQTSAADSPTISASSVDKDRDRREPLEHAASSCSEEDRPDFEVLLTDEAFYAFASLPTTHAFERIDCDLGLLETTPYLGRDYDPAYDATRPPFPCRVLFSGYYGIYYQVDDDAERVVVFAIVDQRRDPANRFTGFEYGFETLE